MNCPLKSEGTQREDVMDQLIEYAAGRLDAAKAAALDVHVGNCVACHAFVQQQAEVWDALDAWEPTPVSMDFNRRLWQRIDAAARSPWYRNLAGALRGANWKPVFPLAAAVLVIAGGFLLDHRGGPASSASVPGVSVIEADQLEQTLDDIQLLRQLDAVATPNAAAKRM